MPESKPRKRKAAKKATKKTKKKSPRRKKPQEPERKFSQEQYDMLLRCSENKDMTEWNEWREQNPDQKILLEDAKLQGAHLGGAKLQGAHLLDANLQGATLVGANLQGVDLSHANLQGAVLSGANLQDASLAFSALQRAELRTANLQGADLDGANLQGANLWRAELHGASLQHANLQGGVLSFANLQGAKLVGIDLQGANLVRAKLQGAELALGNMKGTDFYMAAVDGQTIIIPLDIDKETNFTGVGLDSARVPPDLKQSLKYNIRRLAWKEWYKKHPFLRWPVQFFWGMSDYGRSTGRIIGCFFALAVIFAGIYLFVGLGCRLWSDGTSTGMIANLFEKDGVAVPGWLVPWRALYFSIVTMTTLGFGDMYAAPDSLAGHLVLGLQVLLGYVLLAALVTRFAVLFTAGGPAGKFAPKDKD